MKIHVGHDGVASGLSLSLRKSREDTSVALISGSQLSALCCGRNDGTVVTRETVVSISDKDTDTCHIVSFPRIFRNDERCTGCAKHLEHSVGSVDILSSAVSQLNFLRIFF